MMCSAWANTALGSECASPGVGPRVEIALLICAVGAVILHSSSHRKLDPRDRFLLLIFQKSNYLLLPTAKTYIGRHVMRTLSEHLPYRGLGPKKWIEGDALYLPFPDSFFDAITIGYGLRNVVDRQKAMREIFRVLKPGSKVSVLDFNKSTLSLTNICQEWLIDNIVVPVASSYGLSEEYEYLKASIAGYLTGKELEKLAKDVGFSKAAHYEVGGGFMGNLVAFR